MSNAISRKRMIYSVCVDIITDYGKIVW